MADTIAILYLDGEFVAHTDANRGELYDDAYDMLAEAGGIEISGTGLYDGDTIDSADELAEWMSIDSGIECPICSLKSMSDGHDISFFVIIDPFYVWELRNWERYDGRYAGIVDKFYSYCEQNGIEVPED